MTKKIEKWDYFELELRATAPGNPFLDITLEADFTHTDKSVRVAGFFDGEGVYKIRFMPDLEGSWHFVTHSNLDVLDNKSGSFDCVAPSEKNHGVVGVINQTNFAFSDGTPYHPVGTTCYVWNLQGEALEKKTLETLKEGPFNKIRFCIYPKRYTFNYNEPENYPFPGEVKEKWNPQHQDDYSPRPHDDWWDYDYFNPEYFQHIDDCVLALRDLGIEADLILFHPYDFGAWGFDCIPEKVNNRILKYLVARLGAFRNIWWSFANEYDLFQNKAIYEWDRYMKLVEKIDPYHHLRSIHNCRGFFDHSKSWISHCSIQSKDLSLIPKWFDEYNKPLVIDECGYEGNIDRDWGNLTGKEMVHRFWQGFSLGAYVGHGETYINPQENLWWSKGGQLQGDSTRRIAFLRKIIEEFPEIGFSLIKPTSPSFIRKTAGCGIYPEIGLHYFGVHQPSFKLINLPEDGTWQIDIIDTWEMTITNAGSNFSGLCRVDLPGKEGIAIRIRKN
ncbi:MAG: DUF5060 domain-containing protein [Anaerolineaceae bacterium]|nr:DUF5060 domain-containing protein [Anaerolineaceae bacterium]